MIRYIKSSQGFGLIGILIVIAVIALASGVGLYWNETKKQQSFLQTGTDAKKRPEELKKEIESRQKSIYGGSTSINSDVDTSEWKTYRNEKYGFEFKYPKDWDLSYPEGTIYGETVPMNAPLVTKGPAAEIQAWILPNSDWGGTFSGLNNHVDFELQYAKSYIEGNDPYPFEIFEEAKDNWAIVSREKITVFGRESIKIKFKKDKDKSSILVNIPYKKTSMVFALKMRARVDDPKLDSVMVGIISSLKFL